MKVSALRNSSSDLWFLRKQQRKHDRNQQHPRDYPQRHSNRDVNEPGGQHFHTDEDQDDGQSVVQQVEGPDHSGQSKIERPQPENRKDVGREHDKGLASHGQHCWDGIGREQQVGSFNQHQYHRQWRRVPNSLPHHKELVPFEVLGHAEQLTKPAKNDVGFGVDLCFVLAEQLDSAIAQNWAEDVNGPCECIQQLDSCHDERAPHDQSSQNTPNEHFVLIPPRNREIAEDDQEHEQVVDAERLFDQVDTHTLQG